MRDKDICLRTFGHRHQDIVKFSNHEVYSPEHGETIIKVGLRKHPRDRVPVATAKRRNLPERIEGHKVVYHFAEEIVPYRTTKHDPLVGGISIGHYSISAGTLGGVVYRSDNPSQPLLLSNKHVFHGGYASAGDNIIQPGPWDHGNNPNDIAGYLQDWVEFDLDGINYVDVAVAYPARDVDEHEYYGIGYVEPKPPVVPNIGLSLIKSGRTTGVTYGTVEDNNVSIFVYFGHPYGYLLFHGLYEVTPGTFSAGGDSGSRVWNSFTMAPVGLVFAGSTDFTYLIPGQAIEQHLGVTFYPGELNFDSANLTATETVAGQPRSTLIATETVAEPDNILRTRELVLHEYNVFVQRGRLERPITVASGMDVTHVTLDYPVPVGKSWVLSSAYGHGSAVGASFMMVELDNIVDNHYTTLKCTRRNSIDTTTVCEWQVITGPDFTVQSGVTEMPVGVATHWVPIPNQFDPTSTFVATTNSTNVVNSIAWAFSNASIVPAAEPYTPGTQSGSGYELRFDQGGVISDWSKTWVSWYVVEWAGATVQMGTSQSSQYSWGGRDILPVDLDKSFLLYSRRGSSNTPAAYAVRGYFESATRLRFRTWANTGPGIRWFVVSHPALKVQRGSATLYGTSITPSIDPTGNTAHILLSCPYGGNAFSNITVDTDAPHQGALSTQSISDTTSVDGISIERATDRGTLYPYWEIVEFLKIGDSTLTTQEQIQASNTSLLSATERVAIPGDAQLSTSEYVGVGGEATLTCSEHIQWIGSSHLEASELVQGDTAAHLSAPERVAVSGDHWLVANETIREYYSNHLSTSEIVSYGIIPKEVTEPIYIEDIDADFNDNTFLHSNLVVADNSLYLPQQLQTTDMPPDVVTNRARISRYLRVSDINARRAIVQYKTEGEFSRHALKIDNTEIILIDNHASYETDTFTIEIFCRPSTSDFVNYRRVVDIEGSIRLSIRADGIRYSLASAVDTWHNYTASVPIQAYQWHHIALVKSGTSGKLYLNGHELHDMSVIENVYYAGEGIKIGGGGTTGFRGRVANLRLWDISRTQQELIDHAAKLMYQSPSGLQGCWFFNEGEGTTYYDYSSNENNGHTTNAPAWADGVSGRVDISLSKKLVLDYDLNTDPQDTTMTAIPMFNGKGYSGNPSYMDKTGISGTYTDATAECWVKPYEPTPFRDAEDYTGSDAYMVSEGTFVSSSDLTIECWIKYEGATNTTTTFVTHATHWSVSGIDWILRATNNQVEFRIYRQQNTVYSLTGGTGVGLDGEWRHIAATISGTTANLYIDGSLVAGPTTIMSRLASPSALPLYIGCMGTSGQVFNGYVKDVRYWQVARAQSTINNNKSTSYQGNEANLRWFWKLDETASLVARGYSGVHTNPWHGFLHPMSTMTVLKMGGFVCRVEGPRLATLRTGWTPEGYRYGPEIRLYDWGNAPVVTPNEWNHICVRHTSSNGERRLFVNGEHVGHVTGTAGSAQNIDHIRIGAEEYSGANARGFTGLIRDMRIWHDAREPNPNLELDGTETNLYAYYKLDEAGRIITDSAGNNDLEAKGIRPDITYHLAPFDLGVSE